MSRARFRVLLSALAVAGSMLSSGLASEASASPIVVVSGPNGVTTSFSALSNGAMGFGFTTTAAYTNVTIGITLASFFQSASPTIDVYLTDQIGPGTTVANQIASATVTPSVAASGVFFPYTLTPVTLLSGINLAAGSYFVTFLQTNTTSANIVGDLNGNLTVTTAPGAAVNPNATWLNFSADAYPPAGASLNNTGGTLWFSVDGTPAGPAPVPEPASLVLLASGLALVAVRMRRARR